MEKLQNIEAVEFCAGGIRICSLVFLVSKLRCISTDCDWIMPLRAARIILHGRTDENGLKEFIDAEIPKPASSDAATLDAWQKKIEKCRIIMLEGVKDHIVSNIHGKTSPFLMWKVLTDLFQSKSDQRKLVLKDKIRNIKMEKGDSMPK